jgi:hypothetical protein
MRSGVVGATHDRAWLKPARRSEPDGQAGIIVAAAVDPLPSMEIRLSSPALAGLLSLHKRCAGLDVHKAEVVACVRLISKRKVEREVRRFPTTTQGLLALAEWVARLPCRAQANILP